MDQLHLRFLPRRFPLTLILQIAAVPSNLPPGSPLPNWNPPPKKSINLSHRALVPNIVICRYVHIYLSLEKKMWWIDSSTDCLFSALNPLCLPHPLSLSLSSISLTHRRTHTFQTSSIVPASCVIGSLWGSFLHFGFINSHLRIFLDFYFSMLLHHPTHQQIENSVRQCGNAHKYDTLTLLHNVRISTRFHSMIIKRNGR